MPRAAGGATLDGERTVASCDRLLEDDSWTERRTA
jgi:hypothetical protein